MSKIPWGIVKHNEYPWTPVEMRTRSKATIAAAKTEFRSCSANLEIKKTSLISRSSGVAHEPLGIFATQIIKKGQKLFASTSALKVSDKQASGSCYNCDFPLYLLATHNIATFHCCPDMQFCGKQCLDIAQSRYHKTLCGKDFSDIHRAKGYEGIDSRFALRLLAFIVQNGEHPLNIPEMTWMTPPRPGTEVRATLAGSLLEPIRILQGLGADIFDPKYEKWVLQTVWYDFVQSKYLRKLDHELTRELGIVRITTYVVVGMREPRAAIGTLISCTHFLTTAASQTPPSPLIEKSAVHRGRS